MRFQYQQWAEPVQFAPAVTPDMWAGRGADNPPRKAVLPAAIQAGSLFFVNVDSTPDSWQGYQPASIARKQFRVASVPSFFFPVGAESVYADGFLPTYPDRITRKTFLACQQQSIAFVSPEPNNDGKWSVVYPDRINTGAGLHASRQQSLAWPAIEVVTADKWTGYYPASIDRKRYLTANQQVLAFWQGLPLTHIYPEARAVKDKHQAMTVFDALEARNDT